MEPKFIHYHLCADMQGGSWSLHKLGKQTDQPDARLLVENPFIEHDNSSNKTAGRKKRPSPTLGRFYFHLKYDTWSKKIDKVSDFAFFETSIKIFYLASAITKNPNDLLDC